MAYDPVAGRVLLAGGVYGNGTYATDTWQWVHGGSWTQLAGSSQPSLTEHAMSFDGKYAIMFGGLDTSDTPASTAYCWSDVLRSWPNACPSNGCGTPAPPARHDPGMAYDPDDHLMLLFGGVNGTLLNDLWRWTSSGSTCDGTHAVGAWAQLTTPTGVAGGDVGLAYDTHRKVFVVVVPSTLHTWEYDYSTNTWTDRGAIAGMAARNYPKMVYDETLQRTILFGGVVPGGGSYLNDRWEWDGTCWQETSTGAAQVPPLQLPAMAFDGTAEFLFSGYAGNPSCTMASPYFGDCPDYWQ